VEPRRDGLPKCVEFVLIGQILVCVCSVDVVADRRCRCTLSKWRAFAVDLDLGGTLQKVHVFVVAVADRPNNHFETYRGRKIWAPDSPHLCRIHDEKVDPDEFLILVVVPYLVVVVAVVAYARRDVVPAETVAEVRCHACVGGMAALFVVD